MQLIQREKLPKIDGLHPESALRYLGGNSTLYLQVLKEFAHNHKNLNLRDFDQDLFANMINSLTFFCSSIGALELCKKIDSLKDRRDERLCVEIEYELANLICEVEKFFSKNLIETKRS